MIRQGATNRNAKFLLQNQGKPRSCMWVQQCNSSCLHELTFRLCSIHAHLPVCVKILCVRVWSSFGQHHRNVFANEEASALTFLSILMSLQWVMSHQNRSHCLQSTSPSVSKHSCETCIQIERKKHQYKRAVCHGCILHQSTALFIAVEKKPSTVNTTGPIIMSSCSTSINKLYFYLCI